ncbi:eCIS core domain-containing protein [Anthocerotibacter panamensis]|uniref:eCIS core domain-containing protein n=1 Tax=Anthocerotibacter panamensis TaxID=2857077 RepID=UPI001C403786|nr:DUF4157 domain-containing protein [Anthocerotibacter panamensis]
MGWQREYQARKTKKFDASDTPVVSTRSAKAPQRKKEALLDLQTQQAQAPHYGYNLSQVPVYPKHPTGAFGDTYEQEVALPTIQSQPEEQVPASQEESSFIQPRFGFDFTKIRIDADPTTVPMSREAHGADIFFGAGRYHPQSLEGKQLLAHELTHVVQQTGGAPLQQVQRMPATEDKETVAPAPDLIAHRRFVRSNRLQYETLEKQIQQTRQLKGAERLIYELRKELNEAATGDIKAALIAAILFDADKRQEQWEALQATEEVFFQEYEETLDAAEGAQWGATTQTVEGVSARAKEPIEIEELLKGRYRTQPAFWVGNDIAQCIEFLLKQTEPPKLVAGRLQQMSVRWREGGVDISKRPEILATLYTQGLFGGVSINPNPQASSRGSTIASMLSRMAQILSMS